MVVLSHHTESVTEEGGVGDVVADGGHSFMSGHIVIAGNVVTGELGHTWHVDSLTSTVEHPDAIHVDSLQTKTVKQFVLSVCVAVVVARLDSVSVV